MDIEQIITKTLHHEGGYVNHPNDPGGHTNMGITLATYQRHFPEATVDTLKSLTRRQAISFYREHFYEKYRVDSLPEIIRDVYFDSLVNHGPGNAGKILQRGVKARGVDIKVDGKVGKRTIAGAEKAAREDAEEFRAAVNDARQQFYHRIVANRPQMKVFAKGWRNRVDAFRT